MNNSIKFLVTKKENRERVDIFLSKKINQITRSFAKKLIESKKVKINNKIISTPSTKIKINDKIVIDEINHQEQKLLPKKISLDIIYEDNHLIIVNKPKGMVVHPGAGNTENTLANALAYKYKNDLSDINGKLRPGIIHRIDKDTSGLLVVAKNNIAHSKLGKQFSEHTIKRKYLCLVWGTIRPLKGRIVSLITRSKRNRQLMTVSDIKGKKAITNYNTVKVYNIKDVPKISLIECILETGRTHQIRVHLKYKGVSILGDKQYGKKNQTYKKLNKEFSNLIMNLNGQALHAQTLEFFHPKTNKIMSFKSQIPENLQNILDLLNKLSS